MKEGEVMEKYRFELTLDEVRLVNMLLDNVDELIGLYDGELFNDKDKDAVILLVNKLKNAKVIKESPKKKEAVATARTKRSEKVKCAIQNAINLLRMEDRDITPYAVAKEANISYNTARKYLHDLLDDKPLGAWESKRRLGCWAIFYDTTAHGDA